MLTRVHRILAAQLLEAAADAFSRRRLRDGNDFSPPPSISAGEWQEFVQAYNCWNNPRGGAEDDDHAPGDYRIMRFLAHLMAGEST